MKPPFILIIAGPNGVGKTTFARHYLPGIPDCEDFVNADEIALSRLDTNEEHRALIAGRLTIERVNELVAKRTSFALESTLSGRMYAQHIVRWRKMGYHVKIILLWVGDLKESLERVEARVLQGGHSIPDAVQRRRFERSYRNFSELYCRICNEWAVYDAQQTPPRAIRTGQGDVTI